MKNKKLIATVASLCLVLVAVVAAVVGVLAAAQQQVSNQIKVSYEAKPNVYATVSLSGKTEHTVGAYPAGESTNFNTMEQTSKKDLEFSTANKGLDIVTSENGAAGKFAVYRFTFQNQNPTHALKVAMTYKEPSTGDDAENVRLFWVKSNSDSWVPTVGTGNNLVWNDAGLLQSTATDGANKTNMSGLLNVASETKLYVYGTSTTGEGAIISAGKGESPATGSTQYIYLVVAVIDLNADVDAFAITSVNNATRTLMFDLEGYRAPAQSNNP